MDPPTTDAEEAPYGASSPGNVQESVKPTADPGPEEVDDSITGALAGGTTTMSQSSPVIPAPPVETQASTEVPTEQSAEECTGPGDTQESPPVSPVPAEVCDPTYTVTSSQLLSFVRLHEIIPCDLNQDGVVDLLALNHRLSTGYGFVGLGNGLFTEGPSLDLPFRPAAGMAAGDPCENSVLLVSSVGTIALFHPVFPQDPPSQIVSHEIDIVRLGSASTDAPLAVLGSKEDSETSEVYQVSSPSLTLLGTFPVARLSSLEEWLEAVRSWTAEGISVPILSSPDIQEVALADLNCDGLTDAVSVSPTGTVSIHLSDGLERLASQRTVLRKGVRFTDLRLADLNHDGSLDIVLLGASGDVTIIITGNGS